MDSKIPIASEGIDDEKSKRKLGINVSDDKHDNADDKKKKDCREP